MTETWQEQNKGTKACQTVGVLRLREIFADKQLEASSRYTMAYFRLHRFKGWPRPNPKVAFYAEIIAGLSRSLGPEDEEIRWAEENWEDANNMIVDALGHRAALPAIQAIRNFSVHHADPALCNERRAMAFTAGLDVLVKHYGA